MRLASDIILFDIQTTGPNIDKDHIIQLGASVLDKDNLLEKNLFNSYIRTSLMDSVLTSQAETLRIEPEVMKRAPKNIDAIHQFTNNISSNGILATHNALNVLFLMTWFKKLGIPFPFSGQTFSVWTLGYMYTLQHGMRKQPSLDTFLEIFNLKIENPNNAFERVRLEAEILRRLIVNFTA